MRPSGKMISALPAFTSSIRERTAIGLSGSSGLASVSFTNGRTHHSFAIPTSMAKTGLRVRSDSARPASGKLTWVRAMIRFGPGLVEFADPFPSQANRGAIDDGDRIAERARRHGAAEGDGDQEARHAEK